MNTDRAFLKKAILGLLASVAEERSPGHQEIKADRYVLISKDGIPVEIMFEKNDDAPPNLWCLERAAGEALIAALAPKRSPKVELWKKPDQYGRHSALRVMPQLGEADLVCFNPGTLAQVGQIIDRLRSVTAADLSC